MTGGFFNKRREFFRFLGGMIADRRDFRFPAQLFNDRPVILLGGDTASNDADFDGFFVSQLLRLFICNLVLDYIIYYYPMIHNYKRYP